MRCGHCGATGQDIGHDHVLECSQFRAVEDVERLLLQPAPSMRFLLDGIAISKREKRDDLRDRCIQLAVASVTGETPEWAVRNLAREAALRQLEGADLETVPDHARTAAASLRSLSAKHPGLGRALKEQTETLDDIALALARGTSPALVRASSRLRRMERPDLAEVVASKAIVMNPDGAPPRTTRAGALVDLLRADEGLEEAIVGERLDPSVFTSNVTSRAYRVLDHPKEAIAWAKTSIERNPDSPVGYRTLLAAAITAEDLELSTYARRELDRCGQDSSRRPSKHYSEFLAGVELVKTGDRERGLGVLRKLAELSYEPARRALLQYDSDPRTDRRGPSGRRPPR